MLARLLTLVNDTNRCDTNRYELFVPIIQLPPLEIRPDTFGYCVNQEFKMYFTLNEDHIFSFEAQHLDQEENPFNRAIRDRNPFTRLIPFNSTQNKYDITQERLVNTAKIEAKLGSTSSQKFGRRRSIFATF